MILIKIIISIIFGVLIGLERENQHKVIGIRTTSLITLGSTLFSLISIGICDSDASRVIAQIVSGISFICIGIIVKEGNSVKGLTTSATIWCTSAIGVLVGIGMFKEATLGVVSILIINILFTYFKEKK